MTVSSAPSLDRFIRTYNRYLETVIIPAAETIENVLLEWEDPGFWLEHQELISGLPHADEESDHPPGPAIPSPVHDVKLRFKFIDSVVRKIGGNEDDFPAGISKISLEDMRDVLGARIVVYFPIQLAWLDRLLRSSSDFEIHERQTPKSYVETATLERIGLDPDGFRVNQRKTSGYSSLHYVVRLKRKHPGPRPWFELQARTIAEELWGEIEHQLGYKPRQDTEFSVRRQFRVISDHLHAIDMHLDFIYDQLQYFQRIRVVQDDDTISAENLPNLLANYQIHIAQEDVGGATDILNGYGINTVEDFQQHAQYSTLERIRTSWAVNHDGAQPPALIILHLLASLPSNSEGETVRSRVMAFSEFLRVTRATDR